MSGQAGAGAQPGGGRARLGFPGWVLQSQYLMHGEGCLLSRCLAVFLDTQCWFVSVLVV